MAVKIGTGLDKNTAGALSYVLGPITGIVFLILEKDPFVRFHAMQSIVVFGTYIVFSTVMGMLPFIFGLILSLFSILFFILWLILIYKAWQGDEWEVPLLGKYARRFVSKV